MAKSQYLKQKSSGQMGKKQAEAGQFKDRNLAAMAPEKAMELFQPRDEMPVRMHAQMAGDPVPTEGESRREGAEKVTAAVSNKYFGFVVTPYTKTLPEGK